MSKTVKTILIVIVVGALGLGAYFVLRNSGQSSNNSASSQNTAASTTTQPADVTIAYTNSGFSPKTITVPSGSVVAVMNGTANRMQFDSDPHPTHTDNPELNIEFVEPGETVTFKVTQTGTFGVHNHLNPSDRATIIVE